MKNIKYYIIFFALSLILAKDNVRESPVFSDFQISSERYLTDDNGNVMMYVNVWGEVNKSGHHLVYEGIDLATLISIVGGPQSSASLRNTKIYREVPDENGRLVYNIDLNNYVKSGDRTNFIKIKPNDTIIIPKKLTAYLLDQIGTINTVLMLITLYFQVSS